MEIITKQRKTMLHTKTQLPWENPQRKSYIEKLKEEDETMFQHQKKNPLCEETLMDKKRQPYMDRNMFHLFMKNELLKDVQTNALVGMQEPLVCQQYTSPYSTMKRCDPSHVTTSQLLIPTNIKVFLLIKFIFISYFSIFCCLHDFHKSPF